MFASRPAPICPGDTVLLADVGNSRIKLAVVSDRGPDAADRRLPAVTKRQDLDSHAFRPSNLKAERRGCRGPAAS